MIRIDQSQGLKFSLTHSLIHSQPNSRSPPASKAVGLDNIAITNLKLYIYHFTSFMTAQIKHNETLYEVLKKCIQYILK